MDALRLLDIQKVYAMRTCSRIYNSLPKEARGRAITQSESPHSIASSRRHTFEGMAKNGKKSVRGATAHIEGSGNSVLKAKEGISMPGD